MSPETERGVQAHLPRPRIQDLQDFPHANRPVRACRRVTARADPVEFLRIARRIEFLVALRIAARMGALVPHPALSGWELVSHFPALPRSHVPTAAERT